MGPQAKLDRVDYSQMLTYVANCAALDVLRSLKSEFPEAAKPYCVAGVSVGLYTALVAAEVLTYDEGLLLVKARAEAMRRWSDECKMQALGISGIGVDEVNILCGDAIEQDAIAGAQDPGVHVSHVWGKHLLVCSGLASTVEQVERLVAEGYHNAHAQVLEQCCCAVHTPMAQAVISDVEKVLQSLPLKSPKCNVYFNSGQVVAAGEHPDLIFQGIMAELTTPLRWDSIVLDCLTHSVVQFYECGPGQSLRDLMKFNVYTDVRRCLKPQEFTYNVEV